MSDETKKQELKDRLEFHTRRCRVCNAKNGTVSGRYYVLVHETLKLCLDCMQDGKAKERYEK